MLKCKSRIVDKPKRRKATSLWPNHDPDNKLPVCGGKIELDISIEGGGPCYCGDYCYCTSPELKLDVRCSSCRNPFVDERLQNYDITSVITKLIEMALDDNK